MAITPNQLAFELRLIVTLEQELDFSLLDKLTRLVNVCTTHVGDYAPKAPEIIRDEAIVLMGSYLYDRPAVTTIQYANAFRNSGASALLAQYVEHEAGVARGSAPSRAASELRPSTPTGQVDEEQVRTIVQSTVSPWALAGNPDLIPAPKLANAPSGGGGGPVSASATVRWGWSLTREFTAEAFTRTPGSSLGTTGQNIALPGHPTDLAGERFLYMGVWLAGTQPPRRITWTKFARDLIGNFPTDDRVALAVDGVVGYYYPRNSRQNVSLLSGEELNVRLTDESGTGTGTPPTPTVDRDAVIGIADERITAKVQPWAQNPATGTVPPASLGANPDATKVLYGDGAWKVPPEPTAPAGGGVKIVPVVSAQNAPAANLNISPIVLNQRTNLWGQMENTAAVTNGRFFALGGHIGRGILFRTILPDGHRPTRGSSTADIPGALLIMEKHSGASGVIPLKNIQISRVGGVPVGFTDEPGNVRVPLADFDTKFPVSPELFGWVGDVGVSIHDQSQYYLRGKPASFRFAVTGLGYLLCAVHIGQVGSTGPPSRVNVGYMRFAIYLIG